MDLEILKGTIDILILCALKSKTSYGYEISKLIKENSNNSYEIGEGTLYSSLKRLEQKELIFSCWKLIDERNRKYYTITELGESYLQKKILGIKNLNILLNKLTGGSI